MVDHTKPDEVYTDSSAEQLAQEKLGTAKRAQVFYQKQRVAQVLENDALTQWPNVSPPMLEEMKEEKSRQSVC